jgi:hypothetical protein
MTAAKFKSPIFCVVLRLVYCSGHAYSRDVECLGLVACIIWLHNRTRTEFEKSYTCHELKCSLAICQWCGEVCPAGAEVVLDVIDLMRSLWRDNLLLVPNRSLLNGEYDLITVV